MKRKHCSSESSPDYVQKRSKPANRKRVDPLVQLSTMLESILNDMRALPNVQLFLLPVSARRVPDYYTIITKPMDLQTMRENLRHQRYQTRADFLADVDQIVQNSVLYNGNYFILNESTRWSAEKSLRARVTVEWLCFQASKMS